MHNVFNPTFPAAGGDWSTLVDPVDASGAAVPYVVSAYGLHTKLTTSVAGSYALQTHRLEIDDVQLTREDGSTYSHPGTWHVQVVGTGGALTDHPWYTRTRDGVLSDGTPNCINPTNVFPTKTGIDVLPGSYQVIVQWVDGTGSQSKTIPVTY
jgi:hypothetical protein